MTIDSPDSTRHAPATGIVPSQAQSPHEPHPPDARSFPTPPIKVLPPHRQTRRWRSLAVAGGIILLIGIATWSWWNDGTPPVQYKTVSVDRGPITSIVTATGTVNPVVSVQVGSQVSGKVARISADFNSAVTQGQVLAQIDQQPFKARVTQARAALKSATGNLAKANNMAAQRKRERDRMATLLQQGFVAQSDLDLTDTNYRDALAQVEITQALVDQAEATLSSAELDLGYTTISSPVNGIVISRNIDVGQTVVASFQTPTLFVIAQDLTRMQVNANVSESDIGGVAEGKPARFRVDAYPKQFFEGTVTQVRNAPISIQNVVTYDVVITVDNRELKLKPGMTANVTIVAAQKEDPLRVPNGALRFRMPDVPIDKKATRVWVLGRNGQPRQVDVTTGISDSLSTEIVSGALKKGDRVIVGIETDDERAEKKLPPGFEPGRGMR